MTTSIRSSLLLTIAALFLAGYSFLGATWTAPGTTPPNGNTPAPINLGPDTQAKSGNLMANIMAAATSTWSPRYCDELGNNCWDPATGEPGGGGSGFGYNQTWRNLTAGRASNVWYHNDTGAPIMIYVGSSGRGGDAIFVNTSPSDTGRVQVDGTDADSGERVNMTTVVPVDAYYKYVGDITVWSELRSNSTGPVTYSWYTSAFTCNAGSDMCQSTTGTNTRTVYCLSSQGQQVADSLCSSAGAKPSTSGGSCSRPATAPNSGACR